MTASAPPTDTELDVLKCSWRLGHLSGREAHKVLGPAFDWSNSTTRTILERMRTKGLLTRKDVHGVAVYAPAQTKVTVIHGVMRRMQAMLDIDGPLPASAFSGSLILNDEDIAALEAALAEDARKTGGIDQ